ncbi:MAG: glutamate-5-semialdehyde dehydrogenase [Acidimicrobiales bacterium]
MDSSTSLVDLGVNARNAARVLALASSASKDDGLRYAADVIEERAPEILDANQEDLSVAEGQGVTATAIDRLRLSEARVASMASGLREVAALGDPVGEVIDGWVRPNGLRIRRVRVPLGVIGIIYENRPNVTSDAAALCIKSGNAVMLRGSSSAIRSNQRIASALREGMSRSGLPADAVSLVEMTTRESAVEFMRMRGVIDCLIPRGGHDLVASVIENATVPYVIDGDGNCHVYVDAAADLNIALEIIVNSKMQRPSVCNAAESLLVHARVAEEFLPVARSALAGVELVGDARSQAILGDIGQASDDDFAKEFLDLKLSVAVVDDLDSAIEHVNRFGTGHSEAIVTTDIRAARRFTQEVDAACVLVNASTRFVDGGEFGLGAEIGISTQKLHARGPMGLRELTCAKFVVEGDGQVRK